MKPDAIIFVDVDDSEYTCYRYREPHFLAARKRGLACLTVAKKDRRHLTRLYAESDELFLVERLDEESLLNAVEKVSKEYRLAAVFSYAGQATPDGQIGVTVANVCRSLGLHHSSPEGINACNDKFVMRRRLDEHAIPSVSYVLCQNEAELIAGGLEIGYPLIAKPRFGARSAFIKKCKTEAELLEHYRVYQLGFDRSLSASSFGGCDSGSKKNIPGTTILLEEWIEGVEGTVECVVTENAVYPLIINEKLLMTDRSHTILENLLITPPESFSSVQEKIIRDYACQCIEALGLNRAIAHVEFKMTHKGPRLIEVNPRLGGLYVDLAFTEIAGLCPWETYLDLLLNKSCLATRLRLAEKRVRNTSMRYSMMAFYPNSSGVFKAFAGLNAVESSAKILEFDHFPFGSTVCSETEEYYLLKCWTEVESSAEAKAFYQMLSRNINPIIE